jgi:c-di-GMP-binding flagellar brake protein YcgR
MIERRRYQRVPFHCSAVIAARPDGAPVEAWTIDLSLGGVRLASARVFPIQQHIAVTFHLRDAAQREVAERADGVIVQVQAESGSYIYGVEFLNPLDASGQPQVLRKLERA